MSRFDEAYLIAIMEGSDGARTADDLSFEPNRTEAQTTRDLERLVASGRVERTEHNIYCGECDRESGVEYRYRLK